MRYKNTKKGIFISRPNRFIAEVEVDGEIKICHVKNTGRCKELLIKGVTVILEKSGISTRKTEYDLVIVDTKGQLPAQRLLGLPKSAEIISVVTTDKIAVRNTGILNSKLIYKGFKPRLIINRFKRKTADGSIVNVDSIIDETNARLIGLVPEDKKISAYSGPLMLGIAAKAVFRIAGRIDDKKIPLPSLKEIL